MISSIRSLVVRPHVTVRLRVVGYLCVSLFAARAAAADRPSPKAAVVASNKFGFELYARLERNANTVCSPVSASIALTMAWTGARGQTRHEMGRVLALGSSEPAKIYPASAALLDTLNGRDGKEGVALQIADRLWAQQGLPLQPDYLRLLRDRYRAPLQSLDFIAATEEARVTINRWGAIQTHDRIPEVLQRGDVDTLTRFVITNAVYFKAAWSRPFHKDQTTDGTFKTPAGEVVAKMMHRGASNYRYARARDVQILELDYLGGLSMVVVLPDKADGLDAVERRLGDSHQQWLDALDDKLIDLELPRWTVRSRLPLSDSLRAMGMPTAFTPAADFSGIARTGPLFIHRVLQEAFVDVDEGGTEAAAVTAVVGGSVSDVIPTHQPIPFHADHPFLYLIRDKATRAVLFIGRVVDPRYQGTGGR